VIDKFTNAQTRLQRLSNVSLKPANSDIIILEL